MSDQLSQEDEMKKLELFFGNLIAHGIGGQTSEHLAQSSMNAPVPITDPRTNPWSQYLCIEKMQPTAILPAKNKVSDAGYDLHSFDTYEIPAWESVTISTQIKVAIPPGCYGRVASRSGLAVKSNIEVGAGVIDQGYQGEIMVVLRNFSNTAYLVNKGDRIAQLIITPYLSLPVKGVKSIVELFGFSSRGAVGFGSSGK